VRLQAEPDVADDSAGATCPSWSLNEIGFRQTRVTNQKGTHVVRSLLCAFFLVAVLASCSTDDHEGVSTGGEDDCESHYQDLAEATSRERLDAKLVSGVDPSVVKVRVQGRTSATGADHQPAEIVDLLNAKGRRVMQIEVFQIAGGRWYAGQWLQCTD
jgi:hypothetical protein